MKNLKRERKDFRKVNKILNLVSKDIISARQDHKLRLRKSHIDNYIMQKREKLMSKYEETNKSKLEINTENLKLPTEILQKTFTNIVFLNNLGRSM
jgi:hypothetical protein